ERARAIGLTEAGGEVGGAVRPLLDPAGDALGGEGGVRGPEGRRGQEGDREGGEASRKLHVLWMIAQTQGSARPEGWRRASAGFTLEPARGPAARPYVPYRNPGRDQARRRSPALRLDAQDRPPHRERDRGPGLAPVPPGRARLRGLGPLARRRRRPRPLRLEGRPDELRARGEGGHGERDPPRRGVRGGGAEGGRAYPPDEPAHPDRWHRLPDAGGSAGGRPLSRGRRGVADAAGAEGPGGRAPGRRELGARAGRSRARAVRDDGGRPPRARGRREDAAGPGPRALRKGHGRARPADR